MQGTQGISKQTIYNALRSSRLPEEIRKEVVGITLNEMQKLTENEYCRLVEEVYLKEKRKGE